MDATNPLRIIEKLIRKKYCDFKTRNTITIATCQYNSCLFIIAEKNIPKARYDGIYKKCAIILNNDGILVRILNDTINEYTPVTISEIDMVLEDLYGVETAETIIRVLIEVYGDRRIIPKGEKFYVV